MFRKDKDKKKDKKKGKSEAGLFSHHDVSEKVTEINRRLALLHSLSVEWINAMPKHDITDVNLAAATGIRDELVKFTQLREGENKKQVDNIIKHLHSLDEKYIGEVHMRSLPKEAQLIVVDFIRTLRAGVIEKLEELKSIDPSMSISLQEIKPHRPSAPPHMSK